jgi:hypothetical protein
MSKVSMLLFFVQSSCRLKFLVYSSSILDGHKGHSYTLHTLLFIVVPRGHLNIVHTVLFMQLGCIVLLSRFCSKSFSSYDDMSNLEHLRDTCSSFPSVAKHTWQCMAYKHY